MTRKIRYCRYDGRLDMLPEAEGVAAEMSGLIVAGGGRHGRLDVAAEMAVLIVSRGGKAQTIGCCLYNGRLDYFLQQKAWVSECCLYNGRLDVAHGGRHIRLDIAAAMPGLIVACGRRALAMKKSRCR